MFATSASVKALFSSSRGAGTCLFQAMEAKTMDYRRDHETRVLARSTLMVTLRNGATEMPSLEKSDSVMGFQLAGARIVVEKEFVATVCLGLRGRIACDSNACFENDWTWTHELQYRQLRAHWEGLQTL
jgi:hypothetical protein